jgi:hypothetical protein
MIGNSFMWRSYPGSSQNGDGSTVMKWLTIRCLWSSLTIKRLKCVMTLTVLVWCKTKQQKRNFGVSHSVVTKDLTKHEYLTNSKSNANISVKW